MYSAGLESSVAHRRAVMLGGNHGYRFDGDRVSLTAELAVLAGETAAAEQWALQLWACETPYAGGALQGIKVAEAPVELPLSPEQPARLDAALPARLPVGPRDYSMVLVLASGSDGRLDQIHDSANYPARERFAVPHFDGSVGYRIEGDRVCISVDAVRNPRAQDNLTGSLVLELWALAAPYQGGEVTGVRVAGQELPRVAGQSALDDVTYTLAFTAPPAGRYTLALMLREWTAVGYDTRDYCNFAHPYDAPTAPEIDVLAREDAPTADTAPATIEHADAGADADAEPGEAKAAETAQPDMRTSIQHATAEELLAVQGLNKRLVAEILKARPFTAIEQLLRVRGIGHKRLEQLRDLLKL